MTSLGCLSQLKLTAQSLSMQAEKQAHRNARSMMCAGARMRFERALKGKKQEGALKSLPEKSEEKKSEEKKSEEKKSEEKKCTKNMKRPKSMKSSKRRRSGTNDGYNKMKESLEIQTMRAAVYKKRWKLAERQLEEATAGDGDGDGDAERLSRDSSSDS